MVDEQNFAFFVQCNLMQGNAHLERNFGDQKIRIQRFGSFSIHLLLSALL